MRLLLVFCAIALASATVGVEVPRSVPDFLIAFYRLLFRSKLNSVPDAVAKNVNRATPHNLARAFIIGINEAEFVTESQTTLCKGLDLLSGLGLVSNTNESVPWFALVYCKPGDTLTPSGVTLAKEVYQSFKARFGNLIEVRDRLDQWLKDCEKPGAVKPAFPAFTEPEGDIIADLSWFEMTEHSLEDLVRRHHFQSFFISHARLYTYEWYTNRIPESEGGKYGKHMRPLRSRFYHAKHVFLWETYPMALLAGVPGARPGDYPNFEDLMRGYTDRYDQFMRTFL